MKPWEKYQQSAPAAKPWEQYQQAAPPPVVEEAPQLSFGEREQERMAREQEQVRSSMTALPSALAKRGTELVSGIGESFAKPIYGALDWAGVDVATGPDEGWNIPGKGLLNKEARRQALSDFSNVADLSAAGTVGELAGNISQFALPASGAAKLAGAGRALPAALGADVAFGGLHGAVTAEEGERLEGAGTEAAIALASAGAGAALTKALRGVDVKEGVRKFMDAGGYMTPGQAAKSKAVTGIETVSGVTPFLARGVGESTQEAAESVGRTMMTDVAESFGRKGDEVIAAGGRKGMQRLKDTVNEGYDRAWDMVDTSAWNRNTRGSMIKDIRDEAQFWPADEAATLNRLTRDIRRDKIGIKEIDKKLRDMMEGASDNYDFQQTLGGFKEDLRGMAGDKATAALREMDAGYGGYLTVRDAASKARGGAFDAKTLEQSARKIGGVDRAARGVAPLQGQAEDLAEAMQKVGGEPLDFFRRIARFTPTPIPAGMRKKLGNIVIGQTDTQKVMRELFEEYPEYMGEIVGAAGGLGRGTE